MYFLLPFLKHIQAYDLDDLFIYDTFAKAKKY